MQRSRCIWAGSSVRLVPLLVVVFGACVCRAAMGNKSSGDAIADVEYIASSVAAEIEKLKETFPQLENFSPAEHLRINRGETSISLCSITYKNGIKGTKPRPKDGKKRSVEYIYDTEKGVALYVHFFVGRSRGVDARSPQKIGRLSVHFYVSGPAAEKIKMAIQPALDRLKKEYQSPLIIKAATFLASLADEVGTEASVDQRGYRCVEFSYHVRTGFYEVDPAPGDGAPIRAERIEPEVDGYFIRIILHDCVGYSEATRRELAQRRISQCPTWKQITKGYLVPSGDEYLYVVIMQGDNADLTAINKVTAMLESMVEE